MPSSLLPPILHNHNHHHHRLLLLLYLHLQVALELVVAEPHVFPRLDERFVENAAAAAVVDALERTLETAEVVFDRTIVLESSSINTLTAPEASEEPHPSPFFHHMTWQQRLSSDANSTFLLQVSASYTASSRRAFASHLRLQFGVTLQQYLPHNTFVVYTNHRDAAAIRRLPSVTWLGYLHDRHKLSQTLRAFSSSPSFFGVPSLGEPLLELVVTLPCVLPHRTQHELRHIAARLQRRLDADAAGLVGGCSLRLARHDRLIVRVKTEQDVEAAAKELARDASVQFVERRLRHQFQNRWARGIVQQGSNATADYREKALLSWRRDLQGRGQVLGLGDSGLDKHSCFFASKAPLTAATTSKQEGKPTPTPPEEPRRRRRPRPGNNLFVVHETETASSDKIVLYVPFADDKDASGHGTHVAGTLVGDPRLPDGEVGTLPSFAGMAPEARLALVDVGDANGAVELPDDLVDEYFRLTYEAGARIHTSTWASPLPLYTSEARDIDEFMSSHRDFVVVAAVGNGGSCSRSGTVMSPATSKGCIAVGASLSNAMSYAKTDLVPPGLELGSPHLNERSMASFSSNGPTHDGRMKPDVVAPGYFVFSANTGAGDNSCEGVLGDIVTPNAGTSMAAPVVAGSLALVRQYFTDGFYPTGVRNPADGFEPSGSLLKAMALHSAVKLNGTRLNSDVGVSEPPQCAQEGFQQLDSSWKPSFVQGYGRPQLDRVLRFEDDATQGDRFLVSLLGRDNKSATTMGDPSLEHGEQHVYHLCALEDDEYDLVATMVYTDAPATLGSGIQLVNDLDLVVHVDERVYYGNGGVSADSLNPVEKVVVPATLDHARDVRVEVCATRVQVGDFQPYSLVFSGVFREGKCRDHLRSAATTAEQASGDPAENAKVLRLVVGQGGDRLRSLPRWASTAATTTVFVAVLAAVLSFFFLTLVV